MPPADLIDIHEQPEPATASSASSRDANSFLRTNRVSLIAGGIAAALAVFVYFGMPHSRDLTSLWVLLFKLTPYVAAVVAIAYLDQGWSRRLRLELIAPPLCFLVFFAYFVPKIFFYSDKDFTKLYYNTLIMVPFIILSLLLAMRLGGGSTATVARLGAAMILLQLSGIEDLAFLLVNDLSGTPLATIPDVWTWADHIAVRIGHHPTKYEAYAFITVHIVLAILALALPARFFRALGRRLPTRRRAG